MRKILLHWLPVLVFVSRPDFHERFRREMSIASIGMGQGGGKQCTVKLRNGERLREEKRSCRIPPKSKSASFVSIVEVDKRLLTHPTAYAEGSMHLDLCHGEIQKKLLNFLSISCGNR